MSPSDVSVHVLGRVRLVVDGTEVALPARQHRRLLAALCARAAPSRDQLVDAVWGESPPRSAAKVLQQYVSQLRRSAAPIVTTETGYALQDAPAVLDAARFERLALEGGQALRGADPALAAALLLRALRCWDGPAYGEFACEVFAAGEAGRLEDLRRDAWEDWGEAQLALGRHDAVLAELRTLAAAHPLRERLQALTVLALGRAGHQREALQTYRAAREALVEELGVEPGPVLQDAQRQVLEQDRVDTPSGEQVSQLPTPVNPLRGRDADLAGLARLLERDDVRLVVLTGAGGSGKSRLALEAARAAAPHLAHGSAFVELADVRDPSAVLSAVCSRLGVPRQAGTPLEDLATALRSRELLVVLDNLEQVRTVGPELVELLAQTTHLTLLVTSRVVLHVSGEHVHAVEPLDDEAAASLLVERSGTDLADADQAAVRDLCRRLDGLPLAIELAAARLRTLTPAELLGRLDARLPVLAAGSADLPGRQRTLEATIGWSFDLLSPQEQSALTRLSVFVGSFSLTAAEAVCDATVDLLAGLVDQSLVHRTRTPDGSRYHLLETVREWAEDRLDADGQSHVVRRRHAEHLSDLAATLGLSVDELGSGAPQRHDLARVEQGNLRAALDWAQVHDPVLGLRTAVALEQLWITTDPREGSTRIQALLARAGDVDPALRARAHRDLGGCTEVAGDTDAAAAHYATSRKLFEQVGDEVGALQLRHRDVNTLLARGEVDAAADAVAAALALARDGGHTALGADLLSASAQLACLRGDPQQAYDDELAALTLRRTVGRWPWGESIACGNLADFAVALGRLEDAEEHGREALRLSRDIDDRTSMVFALAALTVVALAAGQHERAGRLWGAVEAEEQRRFLGRWSDYRAEVAERVAAHLTAELAAGRAAGAQLSLDAAAAWALG